MSDNCMRCGNEASRSSVSLGSRLFCSSVCFEVWKAGRDIESLRRIDALEASNDANLAVAKDAQRLLDLREQQLADCTRAMREVSVQLHERAEDAWAEGRGFLGDTLMALSDKLEAARAGKAGA